MRSYVWLYLIIFWKCWTCKSSFQEAHRSVVTFQPPQISFNNSPMYVTSFVDFEVLNGGNGFLDINWIKSSNPQFHAILVEPISISPSSSRHIQVIFLPQSQQDIEAELTIITSEGTFVYPVIAFSTLNPYRVRPLMFEKVVIGTNFMHHPISVHNPHSDMLNVLEIHTADQFVHLIGVPAMISDTSSIVPNVGMWAILPNHSNHVISFTIDTNLAEGTHKSFVYIETDHDKLVVPLILEMVPVSIKVVKPLNFGVLTQEHESRTLDLILSNDGPNDIKVLGIRKLSCHPDIPLRIQLNPNPIIYHSTAGSVLSSMVATVTAIASSETTDFSGTLEVVTNSSLKQWSTFHIMLNGSITRGNILFDHKETTFVINWHGGSWPDKIIQFIHLTNGYHTTATLQRIGLASCVEFMKIGYAGKQNIMQHGFSWPPIRLELVTDSLKRHNVLPKTCWLEISTNISSQRIPLHLIDGKMDIKLLESHSVIINEADVGNKRYNITLQSRNSPYSRRDLRFVISNRNSIANSLSIENSLHSFQLCQLSSWPIGRKEMSFGASLMKTNFEMQGHECGNVTVKPGYNSLLMMLYSSGVPPQTQVTFKTLGNRIHFDIHLQNPPEHLSPVNKSDLLSIAFHPSSVILGLNHPLSAVLTASGSTEPKAAISSVAGSKLLVQSAKVSNSSYLVNFHAQFDCLTSYSNHSIFVPTLWRCMDEVSSNNLSDISSQIDWEHLLRSEMSLNFISAYTQITSAISWWRSEFDQGRVLFHPGSVRIRTHETVTVARLPPISLAFPLDLETPVHVMIPDTDTVLIRIELFNPSNHDIFVRLESNVSDLFFIRDVDVDISNYILAHNSILWSSGTVTQSVSVLSPSPLYRDGWVVSSLSNRRSLDRFRQQRIPRGSRLFTFAGVSAEQDFDQIKLLILNTWSGLEVINMDFTFSPSVVDVKVKTMLEGSAPMLVINNGGRFPVVLSDIIVDGNSCHGRSDSMWAMFSSAPDYCNKLPLNIPAASEQVISTSIFPPCSIEHGIMSVQTVESMYKSGHLVLKSMDTANISVGAGTNCLDSSSRLSMILLTMMTIAVIAILYIVYFSRDLLTSLISNATFAPITSISLGQGSRNHPCVFQNPLKVPSLSQVKASEDVFQNFRDDVIIPVHEPIQFLESDRKVYIFDNICVEPPEPESLTPVNDVSVASPPTQNNQTIDYADDSDDFTVDLESAREKNDHDLSDTDESVDARDKENLRDLSDVDEPVDSTRIQIEEIDVDMTEQLEEMRVENVEESSDESEEVEELSALSKELLDSPDDEGDNSLLMSITKLEYDSSWYHTPASNYMWDEIENDPILNPSKGSLPAHRSDPNRSIDRFLGEDEHIGSLTKLTYSGRIVHGDSENREWLEMNNRPRPQWAEDENILYGPGSYFEKQTKSVADLVLDSDDD